MENRLLEDLREEKRAKVLFLGWEEREAKRNRERRRKKGKPSRIRRKRETKRRDSFPSQEE